MSYKHLSSAIETLLFLESSLFILPIFSHSSSPSVHPPSAPPPPFHPLPAFPLPLQLSLPNLFSPDFPLYHTFITIS